MDRLSDLESLGARRRPVILASGFLDGLHLGHQAVLKTAVEAARDLQGEAWVLTVDPHPMKLLHPESAPAILTDPASRLRRMEETGIDGVVMLPFTQDFARQEPEAFFQSLLEQIPLLRGLVVGDNWRFGRAARGDTRLLRKMAETAGLPVRLVSPLLWKGAPISSSRIRRAVELGDVREAAHMLGRPFSVPGTVVHGRGVGRELGFPTANLAPDNEARPAAGVYAVRVTGLDSPRPGIAYYGERPTFGDAQRPDLEVHLFDLKEDLYGRKLEVHFIDRLRGSHRFSSRDDLIAQIHADVQQARESLC
ncbi:MAG: bifunctional riboflavin kinase/FAD synthetase [Kiritimatiellia bacterium]|nr:bifunctional riboflavin kinase/FAD synthetase [Kiritimatiellia bacterium]